MSSVLIITADSYNGRLRIDNESVVHRLTSNYGLNESSVISNIESYLNRRAVSDMSPCYLYVTYDGSVTEKDNEDSVICFSCEVF